MAPILRLAPVVLALAAFVSTSSAPFAVVPANQVPRAVGFTREIAEQRFADYGVAVTFQPAGLDDGVNARVESLNPVPGTVWSSSSQPVVATLKVLANDEKRIVPDLDGLTVADAITDLGLAELPNYAVQPAGSPVNSIVKFEDPISPKEVDLSNVISVVVYPPKHQLSPWLLVTIGLVAGVLLGWAAKSYFAQNRAPVQ